MNLMSILRASVPLWLASAIVGSEGAGLYGAAVQLTLLISFFLGIANQITPASLAALHAAGDKAALEELLRKTAGWGLIIATPAFGTMLLFGRGMLELIYGEAYRAGYGTLAFLAVAQYINAAAGSPGMLMQMSGKQATLLKMTAFWVSCNIGLGILLAHWAGVSGIAAASCVALIGQNLTMVYYVRREIGVRTYAEINRPPFLGRWGWKPRTPF
jgi:O-antigen/teichoic acid export membrane protein